MSFISWAVYNSASIPFSEATPQIVVYKNISGSDVTPVPNVTNLGGGLYCFSSSVADESTGVAYIVHNRAAVPVELPTDANTFALYRFDEIVGGEHLNALSSTKKFSDGRSSPATASLHTGLVTSGSSFPAATSNLGAFLRNTNPTDVAAFRTLLNSDFTIEFWMYFRGSQTGDTRSTLFELGISWAFGFPMMRLLLVEAGAGSNIWTVEIGCSGFSYSIYAVGFASSYQISSGQIVDRWAHMALVRSGSNTYLYLDGVRVGERTAVPSDQGSVDTISIGGASNGDWTTNFIIDELRISSVARSDSEIYTDYQYGAGLIGQAAEPPYVGGSIGKVVGFALYDDNGALTPYATASIATYVDYSGSSRTAPAVRNIGSGAYGFLPTDSDILANTSYEISSSASPARFGGNVIPDSTTAVAPTVTVVSPAEGSNILSSQSLVFDVIDNLGLFLRVIVVLSYPDGSTELAYNGSSFLNPFLQSSVSGITNGYRFTISRTNGWQHSPTVTVYAFDTEGAESS